MTSVEIMEAPAQGALALITPATALEVFTDASRFSEFYQRVKAETDKLQADVSTKKGRDAIRSMSFNVVKSKTALVAEGAKLKEDAQKTVNAVNASLRTIKEELDGLAAEVRKPLTEWEAAEEARIERVQVLLTKLQSSGAIQHGETSEAIAQRIGELEAVAITDDEFQEMAGAAIYARETALDALRAGLERVRQEEADRAELEQLRAQAAERARLEEERAQAERQEQARLAAENEERERAQLEAERGAQAEQERQAEIAAAEERAAREAAERAEQARQAETARLEREFQDALAASERARQEAQEQAAAEIARLESEAAAERQRHEDAERERVAEQERLAAEQRRREEDRAHRGRIMKAAKEAIMEHTGADEDLAKAVVLAITGGNVPHVRLEF
jgi:hypothetical protein